MRAQADFGRAVGRGQFEDSTASERESGAMNFLDTLVFGLMGDSKNVDLEKIREIGESFAVKNFQFH
jgi:hypothetical protein|tara:strand:- start:2712 stop:2912 length:201 start_codon:yes stop_codon:yes gene_type:complete